MRVGLPAAALIMALTATQAQAQSDWQEQQEGQMACQNDVFALCQASIPDRDRITACLIAQFKRVSPPCREFMIRYSKRHRDERRRP